MRHKWCIKGTRRLKETPHFNNNRKGVYSRNPVCSPVQPGQQPACPAHISVNRSPTGEVRRTTRSAGRQPGSSPEHSKSGCRPVNRPTDRRVRRTARSTGRQPAANRPPTGGAPGPAKGVRSLVRSDRPHHRAVRSVARSNRVPRGIFFPNGYFLPWAINSPSSTLSN